MAGTRVILGAAAVALTALVFVPVTTAASAAPSPGAPTLLGLAPAARPGNTGRLVPDTPVLHLAKATLGHRLGLLRDIACGSGGFCLARHRVWRPRRHVDYLVAFGPGRSPVAIRDDVYLPSLMFACAGPEFCVAGEWSHAMVWDGHGWSTPGPLVPGTTHPKVRRLTCAPGTQLCVYIGATQSVVHTSSGWHKSAYPAGFDHPNSVTCPTATRCLAVRQHATAVFDGHRWRMGGKALALGFTAQVSCPSPGYCVAVSATRTASWHDGHWHNQPPLQLDCTPWALCKPHALACVAPHTCMVAGPSSIATLANGAWSLTAAPPGRRIRGFACSPDGLCRATNSRGEAVDMVAGRWTRAEAVVAYQSTLTDVSCAAANWCMAIDASGQAYLYADGTWTPQGHVDARHKLDAISCTPDHECVAVDADTGTKPSGLYSGGRAVAYVDGQWQPPVQIDSRHVLTDISCATSSTCVAVDSYGRAITLHDGTWSAPQQVVQVGADPPAGLVDVSCPTETYCAAAGRYTYELRGGTWHRITDLPLVMAVDCPDAGYCVVVDTTGIRIRTSDSLVTVLHNKSENLGGFVTCSDRHFCIVDGPFTYQDGGEDFQPYAVAGRSLRRIDYDEMLPFVHGASCAGQFCAAFYGFDAYTGPVS